LFPLGFRTVRASSVDDRTKSDFFNSLLVHDRPRRQAPRPSSRVKNGDYHLEADRGRRRLASFSSGASALDAIGGEAAALTGLQRKTSRLAANPGAKRSATVSAAAERLVVFTLGTAAGRAFHTRAHLRPLAEAHERPAVAAVVHGRSAAVAAEAHERQAAAVVHGRPAAGAHERQAAAAEPHERPAAAVVHERPAAVASVVHGRPAAVVAGARGRPAVAAVVHGRPAAVAGAHGRPAVAALVHGRPAAVVRERPEVVVHERPEVAARSARLPGQSKVD
jgi:hypothetical protein